MTHFTKEVYASGCRVGGFTFTSVSDDSNVTYTASQVLGGYIIRDPNGASRTDTLPSASSLISLWTEKLNGRPPSPGSWFLFAIENTATSEYTVKISGSGLTVHGSVVPMGHVRIFKCLLNADGSTITMAPFVGPFLEAVRSHTVVSTITNAGNATYTADQVVGGLILRDPNGANRTDTTPTAANLIATLAAYTGNVYTGTSWRFAIRNTADAAETITVSAGTGVTLSGTMTIAQNYTREFLLVVTGTSTVTIYSLGTFQH